MQLPSDKELFPFLPENGESGLLQLRFHMEVADNKEKYIDMSPFHSYTHGDKTDSKSDEHDKKLRKGMHELWIHMDKWLGQQLEDATMIDSFPESEIMLFTQKTVISQRRPLIDDDGEVDYEESSDTAVDDYSLDYLNSMYWCTKLFKGGPMTHLYTDLEKSDLYQLMEPIYKALHPQTIGEVISTFLHTFIFPLVGVVIFGICFLLDKILPETDLWLLLRVVPTLLGFGGILIAGVGLLLVLVMLVSSIGDIKEIFFREKILQQAKENFPLVYRRLRYYSLWNSSIKGNSKYLSELQKIVDEYIKQFY